MSPLPPTTTTRPGTGMNPFPVISPRPASVPHAPPGPVTAGNNGDIVTLLCLALDFDLIWISASDPDNAHAATISICRAPDAADDELPLASPPPPPFRPSPAVFVCRYDGGADLSLTAFESTFSLASLAGSGVRVLGTAAFVAKARRHVSDHGQGGDKLYCIDHCQTDLADVRAVGHLPPPRPFPYSARAVGKQGSFLPVVGPR